MKKFDISSVIISRIHDIYAYSLPEREEGSAVTSHSVFIIRNGGESEYTVGKIKYTVNNNSVLFMPAGTAYSMYVRKAGACTVVEFDCTSSVAAQICDFPINGDSVCFSAAKDLLHFWKLKGPAYHSKCLSELYAFITRLSTIYSSEYSLAGKYRMIHKSVKYIEANYRKTDLYTPDLAKMSGMGETYYRTIFSAVFSVAPTKYIQNYRIEKAKELLVNSNGSVEEIAIAVGFANSSYFCKVFKSTVGMTPTDFAEKSRVLG